MLRHIESDPKVERFRFGPLFEELDNPELREIAELTTEAQRPAGTSLIREGGLGNQVLVVLSGQVDVHIGNVVVATLGPGEVVGELAVMDHQPRTADVVAACDVSLLVFDPGAFRQLLADIPRFLDRIHEVIQQRRRSVLAPAN